MQDHLYQPEPCWPGSVGLHLQGVGHADQALGELELVPLGACLTLGV